MKHHHTSFQENKGRNREQNRPIWEWICLQLGETLQKKQTIQPEIFPFFKDKDQLDRPEDQLTHNLSAAFLLLPASKMAHLTSSLGSTQVLGTSTLPLYGISSSPAPPRLGLALPEGGASGSGNT